MKKILASIVTTALIVAMTLGAMFILVQATEYVTSLDYLPPKEPPSMAPSEGLSKGGPIV